MKDALGTILVIIIVIAAVLATAISYINMVASNIYIKPFTKEDIQGISLSGFKQSEANKEKSLVVKVNSCIKNGNMFDVAFSNLFIQVFYNNQLVASSVKVDENTYTIPSKKEDALGKSISGKKCFTEDMQIFINGTTLELVTKIAAKIPVKIDYTVSFKIFGVQIGSMLIPSIKGSETI